MVWCPTWSKNLGRYLVYIQFGGFNTQIQDFRLYRKKGPSDHGLQTPNEDINEKKMFGPNVADNDASAVTKNLVLGYNFRPCSTVHFLITSPSLSGRFSLVTILKALDGPFSHDCTVIFWVELRPRKQNSIQMIREFFSLAYWRSFQSHCI